METCIEEFQCAFVWEGRAGCSKICDLANLVVDRSVSVI